MSDRDEEAIDALLRSVDADREVDRTVLRDTADLLEQLADRLLADARANQSFAEVRRAAECRERARVFREAARRLEDARPAGPGRSDDTGARPRRAPVAIDPVTRALFDRAGRVARSTTSVLLTGETGTGKELLARWIHRESPRRRGPFVTIDCGAIPESLACAELFGHEEGAFSGASGARVGYFEAASGGTLFLDEVGELSPGTQTRLLRALETREVRRVGSTRPIPVDVRLVAATHRDLDGAVRRGAFRADLLYRLDVVRLEVPPLRARAGDLDALTDALLDELSGGRSITITESARARLRAHHWPGNVRELRNVLERALSLDGRAVITERSLVGLESDAPAVGARALEDRVGELERRALREALDACGGNQTRAAQRLGLTRRALIYRLRKYGL